MTAPKGSFFLFGLRGVGKSTWTRREFPDAYLVDLLDESRYQTLTANPGEFALELQALPRQQVVVIGELPKIVRRILVYTGDRRLKTAEGIEVWPLQSFLSAVADGELWP